MTHQHSENDLDAQGPGAEQGVAGAFLFEGVSIGSPAQELAATAHKKARMYQNLGEDDAAERVRRAHELAAEKLEGVLAAPLAVAPFPSARLSGVSSGVPATPGREGGETTES